MTGLLVSKWRPGTPMQAREAEPWVASGLQTADAVIKAAPGILGGVLVTALDDGGDIVIKIWDNATEAAGVVLAKVTVSDTVTNYQRSFGAPSAAGVGATEGLFLEVVTGDPDVVVYYK